MTAAPPFSAPRYDLGDLVLEPVGDAAATIAERLAGLDPWARTGRTADDFRAWLAADLPGTWRFALRIDGALVGVVGLRHPFMRGPYLETIAVFPEAQRRGIARRIVAWMAAEAGDTASNLWLCVTEWNAVARAAYAALGFVEVAPIADLAAVGVTEIFLRKILRPPQG